MYFKVSITCKNHLHSKKPKAVYMMGYKNLAKATSKDHIIGQRIMAIFNSPFSPAVCIQDRNNPLQQCW